MAVPKNGLKFLKLTIITRNVRRRVFWRGFGVIYIYIYRERERRASPPRELSASAYYACMREDDERIIKILDKRITCNRKDLQQLVAGSTAAVCAPWDAENKAFQY